MCCKQTQYQSIVNIYIHMNKIFARTSTQHTTAGRSCDSPGRAVA